MTLLLSANLNLRAGSHVDQAEAATPIESPLFYRREETKASLGQQQQPGVRVAGMGDSAKTDKKTACPSG